MRVKWIVFCAMAPAYCCGADQAPSPRFLEFLGNAAEMGTQWIDPMSLRETPEPFAALTPVKKDGRRRARGEPQPDAAPPKDAPAAPQNDKGADGGDAND